MNYFHGLSPSTRSELIAKLPGRVIRIPKFDRPTDDEILVLVVLEVQGGHSEYRACCRVAGRLEMSCGTIRAIVARRRIHPPGVDPEHGQSPAELSNL